MWLPVFLLSFRRHTIKQTFWVLWHKQVSNSSAKVRTSDNLQPTVVISLHSNKSKRLIRLSVSMFMIVMNNVDSNGATSKFFERASGPHTRLRGAYGGLCLRLELHTKLSLFYRSHYCWLSFRYEKKKGPRRRPHLSSMFEKKRQNVHDDRRKIVYCTW